MRSQTLIPGRFQTLSWDFVYAAILFGIVEAARRIPFTQYAR